MRTGHAAWLPSLAAVAGQRLGLDFPPERWAQLERTIHAAAREQGTRDADAFARRLLDDAASGAPLDLLAHALTVGETYFFREPRSFEVLEQEILPALIAARRATGQRLRLWSAGCCTGEEAYSLAIVVDRLLPQRHDGQVTILATDVNPRFLHTAQRAEFGPWSFRGAPPGLQERYFTPVGEQRFALDPRIRRMVKFARLNLAEPGYPAWGNDTQAMDIILCRNVLMYFSAAQALRVVGRLREALVDGGWLSLSATEAPVKHMAGLEVVAFEGATFQRASSVPAEPPRLAPWPPMQAEGAVSRPVPAAAAAQAVHAAVAPAEAGPRAPEAAPAPAPHGQAAGPLSLAQAQALADAGRLQEARAAIEQLLSGAKLDPAAHYLHAVILQELGQDAQAAEALKRALYLDPDFALAHHALGQLALRAGRGAPAMRHLRHALTALDRLDAEAVLPHSGGLAAGHLRTLIGTVLANRWIA